MTNRDRAPHASRLYHIELVGGPTDRVLVRARMRLEDLGLIGNCQFSALVRAHGRDRLVLPAALRLGAGLLDAARRRGRRAASSIGPADGGAGRAALPRRTPTCSRRRFETPDGAFRVLDFAPRFLQHDRMLPARPSCSASSSRSTGTPRIRVRCEPRLGWSKARPRRDAGLAPRRASRASRAQLRLTTDIPLSYLGGAALRADRAPAPRAHLGRAGRGAARAAVRPLPRARRCATGSAG